MKMSNSNNLYDYLCDTDKEQTSPKKDNTGSNKAFYVSKIKEINMMLSMNGFNEIGDLFNSSTLSVSKTLKTVQAVLEDRQKVVESKTNIFQKLSRQEAERQSLIDKIDELNKVNADVNKKLKSVSQKLSQKEKEHGLELSQLKMEKDDVYKSLNMIKIKESQYKHENKKLENDLKETKNKLKKFLCDSKPSSSSKDLAVVSSGLGAGTGVPNINLNNSVTTFSQDNLSYANSVSALNSFNARHREFYDFLYIAYTEKLRTVMRETELLKTVVINIQSEINQFISFKKSLLMFSAKNSNMKLPSDLISKYLELDIHDSGDALNKKFDQLLKNLRYYLIYDVYGVKPIDEFSYDEIKNKAVNSKFEFDKIPYYKDIHEVLSKMDYENLEHKAEGLVFSRSKEKEAVENELLKASTPSISDKIADLNSEILQSIENLGINK